MIFQTITPQKEVTPLTGEQAMIIYGLFKAGKNETQMFIDDGIDFIYSEQVRNEIERLQNEVNTKMSGQYLITPEEFHYDEEGLKIVDTEAVYFVANTELQLVNSLSSDLLDVATVVKDIIIWRDGNPETEMSWYLFSKSYK